MGIEAARHMAFHCSLGDDVLVVRSLTGSEQLGDCFEYVVTLYGEKYDIELDTLLGQQACVEVRMGRRESRYFSGIVCEMSQQGTAGRYVVYQVTLRPWLWLLAYRTDCRIFQQETALEIVRKVFKEHESHWFDDSRIFQTLKQREYCVQYCESDLNFVSRLLQDEGIYYFFEHERGKHTLLLADASSAHAPASGYETVNFRSEVDGDEPVGVVFEWHDTRRVVSNKVSLADYDFKKSLADLSASSKNPDPPGDHEVYAYPGLYAELERGNARVRLRAEELGANYDVATGSTTSRGLTTGNLFSLERHPCSEQNRTYLLVAATYALDSGSYETEGTATGFQFISHLTAIDSQTQFRPARSARAPSVAGVQTARVVGPKGREIWTDSHGRVKVQFHWDREGKRDECSSCWIRVAQLWAGPGWGGIHIPRIGQEVVVEFVDGNVDRPLIIGCVYNDINAPPYDVPMRASQSGIKSHSTPKGGPDNYNELRFEDDKGNEQLYMQAERNMDTLVKNDQSLTVGNNRKKSIGVDETTTIGGNRSETVSGDEFICISGTRTESVEKAETITLQDSRSTTVFLGDTLRVGKDYLISVDGSNGVEIAKEQRIQVTGNRTHQVQNDTFHVKTKLVIDAGAEIVFRTGASSITLKSSGDIAIRCKSVSVAASDKVDIRATSDVRIKGARNAQN